jgi:hypothetical protein
MTGVEWVAREGKKPTLVTISGVDGWIWSFATPSDLYESDKLPMRVFNRIQGGDDFGWFQRFASESDAIRAAEDAYDRAIASGWSGNP